MFPPILSRLTQEEALADPALLVILADESVLGHIMAIPTTPIRLTGNGPLPHTSSARTGSLASWRGLTAAPEQLI